MRRDDDFPSTFGPSKYFGDRDPTTRVLLEHILAQEEEHANDMHDLLVSHEGQPMLEK